MIILVVNRQSNRTTTNKANECKELLDLLDIAIMNSVEKHFGKRG